MSDDKFVLGCLGPGPVDSSAEDAERDLYLQAQLAPELLAALEALLPEYEKYYEGHADMTDVWVNAKRAINKARGIK